MGASRNSVLTKIEYLLEKIAAAKADIRELMRRRELLQLGGGRVPATDGSEVCARAAEIGGASPLPVKSLPDDHRVQRRVLVIDSDGDCLDVLSCALSLEGYHVLGLPRLGSFERIAAADPDVILLDTFSQPRTGDFSYKELKTNPLTSHYPVILVSTELDLPDIAMECRADDFIAKPFDVEALLSRVARLLP
ncbi:MAG: response regulator [Mucilaginibacter sp.]